MTRRLLVTGSRKWAEEWVIRATLTTVLADWGNPPDALLISGACPTGADRIAEGCWDRWNRPVELHPARWDAHGKAAGPLRNQEMVDAGADLCLAFPVGDSPGTRDCMGRARAAGIPVRVVRGPA